MSKYRQRGLIQTYFYFTLLFLAFFISRLIFINPHEVFFDSGEYLNLFSNSNFLQALYLGHTPPHIGYILFFWPVFQFAKFMHLTEPASIIVIFQILLGFLTVLCFYRIVYFVSDKKTALIASIIISSIPLFWITNVTITMEIAYVSMFFFSIYFLTCYIRKNKLLNLQISLLFLSLAVLTHTMTALWIPLYLSVIFFLKNKDFVKIFIYIIIYLVGFSILNILLISKVLEINMISAFHYLYLNKGGEFATLSFDTHSLLVILRNFFIPLLHNNTSLIFILGFTSLLISFKKNKKIFAIGIFFIAPAIYTNQWWDSLLNGRHALIASFGFAFMTAYLIRKKTAYIILIILYLIFVSLPALNLLKKPIPYIQEAEFINTLPKGSLLIESHFARPQTQEVKDLKVVFVNEPGFDKNLLKKEINQSLINSKPVFISSAALSEPYGLYSGPYLHNITLSYVKAFELESIIKEFTLEKYKEISLEDNLLIYQIKSNKPSPYPKIKNMQNSYRRISYNDPFWKIFTYILEYKLFK